MVSDKIAAKFDESPLWLEINYNSHPLTLAVSLAVINIYESDNLIENTNKMCQQHPSIGDFRNKGLLDCLYIIKSKKPYQLMEPFNLNAAEMEVMNKVGGKIR